MRYVKLFLYLLFVSALILPTAVAQEDGLSPDLAETLDAIEAMTAELRELATLAEVDHAMWTPEEVRAWLGEELTTLYSPDMARDDVIFYHALDFMPLDTDLWQLQLDLLSEQVGGFYEPDTQSMVVVDLGGGFDALAEVIYVHEYTHALQDQHFDLDALGLEDPDKPLDETLALLALVEGDASQLMADYTIWRVQQEDGLLFSASFFAGTMGISTEQLDQVPPILRAELEFPYLTGQGFVLDVLSRGNWVLLNAVYERPPLSTEHILHPQQYFDGDEPQIVDLALPADALGDAWRLVSEERLGEFYLRHYLDQYLDREMAVEAAEGWGGDRFLLYHDDTAAQSAWLYRITWDASSHAREFIDAFTAFSTARYNTAFAALEDVGVSCWEGDALMPGEAKTMLRSDAMCLYYEGLDTLLVQAPDLDTATMLGEQIALSVPE